MEEKEVKYLIFDYNDFVVDKKLEEFNRAGNFKLLAKLNNSKDLFIQCTIDKPDIVFAIDNENFDSTIDEVLDVVKTNFPTICVCSFSDKLKNESVADYEFSLKDVELQLYNMLLKIKYRFNPVSNESFYVPPHKITELFDLIGIQKKYKGYHYLKIATEMLCNDRQCYLGNIHKLYEDVALKYNVTVAAVERCIRLVLTETALEFDFSNLKNPRLKSVAKALEKNSNAEFLQSAAIYLSEDIFS